MFFIIINCLTTKWYQIEFYIGIQDCEANRLRRALGTRNVVYYYSWSILESFCLHKTHRMKLLSSGGNPRYRDDTSKAQPGKHITKNKIYMKFVEYEILKYQSR